MRAPGPEHASGVISSLLETRVAIFRAGHPRCEALDLAVSPVVVGRWGCDYVRTSPGARFLTRDPAAAITREPYGYTGNNPLNGTDPTGLFCVGDLCTDGVTDALDDAWDSTGGKVVSAVDDHSKGLAQIGTGIAFLGYAVCPVTAGIGCAVGQTAFFASAGLYTNAARHACGDAGFVSSDCGLAALDAGLSWRARSFQLGSR